MHSREHSSYEEIQDHYTSGELNADYLFDQDPEDTNYDYDTRSLTDGERQLLADIEKLQPGKTRLTLEEEQELFSFIDKGRTAAGMLESAADMSPVEKHQFREDLKQGEEAKQQIFNANLKFIAHFARSSMGFHSPSEQNPRRKNNSMTAVIVNDNKALSGRGLDFGDRFSIAAAAFLKAIEKSDPKERQGSIRAYAIWRMTAAILRAKADSQQTPLDIPVEVYNELTQIEKAKNSQTKPDNEQLAKTLGWSAGKLVVREATAVVVQSIPLASLEAYFESKAELQVDHDASGDGDTEQLSLSDHLVDTHAQITSEDIIMGHSIGQDIDIALSRLPERTQAIVEMRFGLGISSLPRSLDEVGAKFNITRERVRQIEGKALDELRNPSINSNLVSALNNLGLDDPRYGLRDFVPLTVDDDDALGINRTRPHALKPKSISSIKGRMLYSVSEFQQMFEDNL